MTPDASSDQTPRLRRFACMMYEAVLLFGVVFLAGYLMDTLTQSRNALELRPLRQAWLFVAIGACFVLCWRRRADAAHEPGTSSWSAATASHPPMPLLMLRYILAWPLVLAGAALVWLAALQAGRPWTCSSSQPLHDFHLDLDRPRRPVPA